MTKRIINTYVKRNSPTPEYTRPSLNKKEMLTIRSRREALIQVLNELEKQQVIAELQGIFDKQRPVEILGHFHPNSTGEAMVYLKKMREYVENELKTGQEKENI